MTSYIFCEVKTYTATIYLGFKEHYSGVVHTLEELQEHLQRYVDTVGLCVTLTPTVFIYKNGNESGAIIGLINYPRFPCTPEDLRTKALFIASELGGLFLQYRVSIVFPDQTIMISGPEDPQ